MRKKIGFVFVFLFIAMLISNSSVWAVEKDTGILFSIDGNKSYDRTTVTPGETRTFNFHFENVSSEERTFFVHSSDILSAVNGGMTHRTNLQEEDTDVGTWFLTEDQEITLGPGEKRTVTYTVDIPDDLTPGQHIGVVAYSYFLEGEKQLDSNFSFDFQYSSGKQIVFDYEIDQVLSEIAIEEAELSMNDQGKWTVKAFVRNDGDILDKPKLELSFLDEDGNVVIEKEFVFGSVYPRTRTYTVFPIDVHLKKGTYTLELSSGNAKKQSQLIVSKEDEKKGEEKVENNADNGEKAFSFFDFNLKTFILIVSILLLILVVLLLLYIRKLKKKMKSV